MAYCEGRKGEAKRRYEERMEATRDIVKKMPYEDENIIAAVYADGKSYTINGCQGMEQEPESVRIIGKNGDMYQVVWGKSIEKVEVRRDELSKQIDSYFGEEQKVNQTVTSHDIVDHEGDR